ncbi:MAG: hypothetical protein LBH04_11455 [Tannerellaceae bacterium]|nr:hypothetical protein [Tannerellaceae bacterium]
MEIQVAANVFFRRKYYYPRNHINLYAPQLFINGISHNHILRIDIDFNPTVEKTVFLRFFRRIKFMDN